MRDTRRGEEVTATIRAATPGASVEVRALDLASLASIATFATTFRADHDRLDVLVNNAGVMVPPFGRTADGFELQMGTNHFGTFALTGRLLPLLRATQGSRVTVTTSVAHKRGKPDLDDLDWTARPYDAWQAYSDSKIANLLFAFELVRRLEGRGPSVVAAHPGWTATDLQRHSGVASVLNHLVAMRLDRGVLSPLRAATDPAATSGDFFGPTKFADMRGDPDHATAVPLAHDRTLAARLWAISTDRTGVTCDFGETR